MIGDFGVLLVLVEFSFELDACVCVKTQQELKVSKSHMGFKEPSLFYNFIIVSCEVVHKGK